jgi:hypothetical protein
MPAGSPAGSGVAEVAVDDDLTLPLLVLWPAGAPGPAVARLRAGMATER